jgi:hypothetical protein
MSLLFMYRRFAELCSQSAAATTTPEIREQWVTMAISWRQKAEAAELLEAGSVVHEKASVPTPLQKLSEAAGPDHLGQAQTIIPALARAETGVEGSSLPATGVDKWRKGSAYRTTVAHAGAIYRSPYAQAMGNALLAKWRKSLVEAALARHSQGVAL